MNLRLIFKTTDFKNRMIEVDNSKNKILKPNFKIRLTPDKATM